MTRSRVRGSTGFPVERVGREGSASCSLAGRPQPSENGQVRVLRRERREEPGLLPCPHHSQQYTESNRDRMSPWELAFPGGLAMVRAMTTLADLTRSERPVDASVVTSVVDIAGSRHEVLPPRQISNGGLPFRFGCRAAPP